MVTLKMKKKSTLIPETGAYIWLQDDETQAVADCGCQIDGQAFYQCTMHAAAPELAKALWFCRSVLKTHGAFDMSEKMAIKMADKAITKANGK